MDLFATGNDFVMFDTTTISTMFDRIKVVVGNSAFVGILLIAVLVLIPLAVKIVNQFTKGRG